MDPTSGVSRIPVRANSVTSSSSDTMETTTGMNGAANGSLVSKNTGIGSRIPKLFGKASTKQTLNGLNASEPLRGSDEQPTNSFETNQPMGNGNTINSPINDNIINDVINGTNGTSDYFENDVKFDVIVTMDTDGSDNDSNGMPRCLMEKFRHRSGTTSSTDGDTADLSGVHSPNDDPNGMPQYLTEKFRHRSRTMGSTDGETVDLNGVHVRNGDPIGVDNKIGIPNFFMEKIRHRSGGTVTDANGDLSEDVGSDGVVVVDIGGVGENKKVALRKRNLSASNGVDNNNIMLSNGKPTETMNYNDRNVEKNVEMTNRKSKLPTLPRTSFVRRLENRFSSGDSFERPNAERQNGEDVNGTKIYADDIRRTRNKSPESKLPISMVTNPVSKVTTKSPRKFVTKNHHYDNYNDYDAEDELDVTSHKPGQGQKVKVISHVNCVVNGDQQNGEMNYETCIDLDLSGDKARLDQNKEKAEYEEEENVKEFRREKIKNTNRSPNRSGLKPLMMHRGEVTSKGCQQVTVTKNEQWCNNVQANASGTRGQRAQGRADCCVAEKQQNAFKGNLTDAYNENGVLYAVVGAGNGKDQGTGEADAHQLPVGNGPSCHKLVENHQQSQTQCVQRSRVSVPHGQLENSSNSQNSVHSDRLLPTGTANEKENLDDVQNLENLEAEFMKALDAMDPPEPDVLDTGNTCINQHEHGSSGLQQHNKHNTNTTPITTRNDVTIENNNDVTFSVDPEFYEKRELVQNVYDNAKRRSDKNEQQKEDSGDVPIIPRQNILDELENNGRHLHTNGDVQCIMENSQSCIPGASIRSVSETEGGGGSGGGNVKTEMDVKQNSGVYRERIANEREACCPRRDEQDANTVANGNHGLDVVTSRHGENCLQDVMEHRQGYGISNDLVTDSNQVITQYDNQISEELGEKRRENYQQNISSGHIEKDETVRAENVANQAGINDHDLGNDLEVTVKVTSTGFKSRPFDNFDYIFRLVDSAVDEALREMQQQQQGRAVLVTKTTREEDTEISSQKTTKMEERKPSGSGRGAQVQLKPLPVVGSGVTPKGAGASRVTTDVKRVSEEASRDSTTLLVSSSSKKVKEFKSFNQQQQQQQQTTVTKATNSVTTVTKGSGPSGFSGKSTSQSATTSFSTVSVQRSENQPTVVRTWDQISRDQNVDTKQAQKSRIVPMTIEKKGLQPEISEAKGVSIETGIKRVTPEETKQQLKNAVANANNRAGVVTKSNKEDMKKTAGSSKEKPKQGTLVQNKMDEDEKAKDKTVISEKVEDGDKDKETELDESTDSADSVVKVNGVVAKVGVVTKETEPKSVTNRRVEEAKETPGNKTIDDENKDKGIEHKDKAIDNKEKPGKTTEPEKTEPEPKVKSNAETNRDPAVIDHVSDDVTETQLLSHQRHLGLPHVRRLNGFRAGRSLCVEGIVNKNAKCFSINLQSTHANPPRTDVALMLSPSLEDKTVTANSFMYEAWGAAVEQKKNFPFTEGKKFTVRIECESSCYKIFVNDDWLMDYDHRMPLDKTCYVRLDGDAAFFNVECPHVLELPKIVDIPQGFRVGSNFQMDAFIWPKASSFEVNFLTGPVDKKDKKEPQASFSLRSLFNAGKTKVEMNCMCDGKAGEEGIVEGDLSLQPTQDVKLRIIAEEGNFKVEMDDFYFAEYDHKLPINKFTHAVIDGDISLYGVKVNRPSRRRMSTLRKASVGLKNENCCPCSIT